MSHGVTSLPPHRDEFQPLCVLCEKAPHHLLIISLQGVQPGPLRGPVGALTRNPMVQCGSKFAAKAFWSNRAQCHFCALAGVHRCVRIYSKLYMSHGSRAGLWSSVRLLASSVYRYICCRVIFRSKAALKRHVGALRWICGWPWTLLAGTAAGGNCSTMRLRIKVPL